MHDSKLHPVAFWSRKLLPAEENYGAPDQEMLAIVKSVKHWRHYLKGVKHPIKVQSDHKNLETFLSTKALNLRQARWYITLSSYDLDFEHIKGFHNPADGPSRRPDYRLLTTISQEGGELTDMRTLTSMDEFAQNISAKITRPDRPSDLESRRIQDGILFHNDLIYVPDDDSLKLRLLRAHHDDPLAGHFGTTRTLELLTRNYYWPSMRKYVKEYIRSCDVCQRSKPPRHKPHGELSSLPVPDKAWSGITMDFVTDLPPSGPLKFDAIWVIVCHLTKMVHYVPCHKTNTATWLAKAFIQEVIRLHGLPDSIVSDRGTTFTSRFWSTLCHHLKITRKLSTAFHAQTDGQTERMNQTMEQYLRSYINYQQDDWLDWLPLAEFAYNNSRQATTEQSPFCYM
jgi:RNase H-like domain found in reverse transcriptase/Integrase zinc binding domain